MQATVVSKMLEQGGFRVDLQMLDPAAYNRQDPLERSGAAGGAAGLGYCPAVACRHLEFPTL